MALFNRSGSGFIVCALVVSALAGAGCGNSAGGDNAEGTGADGAAGADVGTVTGGTDATAAGTDAAADVAPDGTPPGTDDATVAPDGATDSPDGTTVGTDDAIVAPDGSGDTVVAPSCTPKEFAKLSAKGDLGNLMAAGAAACASVKSGEEFAECIAKVAAGAGIDANALKLCVCPLILGGVYKDCVVPGGDVAACAKAKVGGIASYSDLIAVCEGKPAGCKTDSECTALGQCGAGKCDNGTCKVTPVATGSACNDGNACNSGEACDDKGGCSGGTAVACDDGNPCTVDKCNPGSGCVAIPLDGTPCDDGDACTTGDACANGACANGKPTCACKADSDCDDGNACTTDKCGGAACKNDALADGGACSDGDACTEKDVCASGKCKGSALVCDDSNPCTVEACKPLVGCVSDLADGAACDDKIDCTKGDSCQAGQCAPGVFSCVCKADSDCDDKDSCTADKCNAGKCANAAAADGGACDDGDACTDKDACKGGACAAGATKACDDKNPCTADVCDAKAGCKAVNVNDAPCDDGSKCTAGDGCLDGKCAPGPTLACDDSNPCTDDSCDAAAGCANANNKGQCNDNNSCTTADVCVDGACVPGADQKCDDGNPCSDDSCDKAKGCVALANTATCSDGDECTAGDSCKDSKCTAGGPAACDDGNPCTDDSCDKAQGCLHAANTAICSDKNVCTEGDVCKGGACGFQTTKACDDGNPCTDDTCDPSKGGCLALNNQAACDDGNACTDKDICGDGKCGAGPALKCDDGNLCTDDKCDPAKGCTAANNTAACDDGDKCNDKDACLNGKCAAGTTIKCDDSNVCTDDACDPAKGCFASPNKATCDDGDPCTGDGNCIDSKCGPGAAISCDDKSPCTKDSCDPKSGKCLYTAVASPCDDGDACTTKDACLDIKCVGTATKCDDSTACTSDVCDPKTGGCLFTPTDGACDDGNQCTDGDVCALGKCTAGKAIVCDDSNTCTTDSCDKATGKCGVVHVTDKTACDDGSKCTNDDACLSGKCAPGVAVLCNDSNACTTDTCDPDSGCVFLALNATPCDDGTVCTVGDACTAGKCTAAQPLACVDDDPCTTSTCDAKLGCVYKGIPTCAYPVPFGYAFDCNDSSNVNWTLGKTTKPFWGIDALPNPPAFKSAACSLNFNDNKDYTCAAGAASIDAIDASAVSPPIDATPVDASLAMIISFNLSGGWENGTFDSLNLETSVDAGKTWVLVKTYDHTTNTWDPITEKVAGLAGKKFNLRFRFLTSNCTLNTTVGAFIDDLVITPDGCSANTQCNDKNPCTSETCNISTFKCVYANTTTGSLCTDGSVCTVTDTCAAGKCVSGAPLVCDDKNACTGNSCNATQGCKYAALANGSTCTDSNACTKEACQGGSCAPAAIVCVDNNVCTTDSCNTATGCVYPPVSATTTCTDNTACTSGDTCSGGKCVGAVVNCNDNDACSADSCDAVKGCGHAAIIGCAYKLPASNNFPCNAVTNSLWTLGKIGNVGWAFDATPNPPGAASAGCALNYNNGTNFVCPVLTNLLDASAVSPPMDATALYATTPVVITFSLAGTWESGAVGKYDNLDLDYSVNGGQTWTTIKTYDGTSLAYATVTETVNGLGGKVFQLRFRFWTLDCKDNTGTGAFIDNLTVAPKLCVGNPECDDKNTCTTELCDTTQQCKYTTLANGATCTDGSDCTAKDACATGKCVGQVGGCNDGNGCTLDVCVGGTSCVHNANTGATCDDGNACTANDKCTSLKACAGAAVKNGSACTDNNPCTNDACQSGACASASVVNGTSCKDGDACTSDVCTTGKCVITAVNCDDKDPCTTDSCSPTTGCGYAYVTGCKNALPYTEAFDCTSPKNLGWTLGKANTPVWAIDATPNPPGALGGTGCSLNFNNGTNFTCGSGVTALNASAISPIMDATAVLAPNVIGIGFSLAGTWESGADGAFDNLDLEVSTNGGQTWSLVATYDGNSTQYTSRLAKTALPVGKTFQIRFRFWTTDCLINVGTGPHIDGLTVSVAK